MLSERLFSIRLRVNRPLLGLTILALLALPGCGESTNSTSGDQNAGPPSLAIKPKQADPDSATTAAPTMATPTTGPFAVPEGSPQDLMGYIERIRQLLPNTSDRSEQLRFHAQQHNAVALAVDKALSATDDQLDNKTQIAALVMKFNALASLREIEYPGASQRLDQFSAIAVTQIDRLLKATKDKATIRDAEELKLNALYIVGLNGSANDVSRFHAFASRQAASREANIAQSAHAARLNFRLSRITSDKTTNTLPLVNDVRHYLASTSSDASSFELASQFELVSQIAKRLKDHGDAAAALTLQKHLVTTFEKHADSRIAEHAQRLGRRLSLIGSTLSLDGVLVNGQPLDWQQYRGKVVLVDFWATWCGPCVKSLPEIKKSYQRFHDQGFEVVGISLDSDRDQLLRFLKSNSLPWPIVANMAGKTDGKFDSNVERCGVEEIPLVVLIDQTGKVVDAGFYSEKIDAQIAQLLDLSSSTPDDAKPENSVGGPSLGSASDNGPTLR